MGSNTLKKRCPQCKRRRKFTVPPDHCSPSSCIWEKVNDQWICGWCVARAEPGGEEKLRQEQAHHRLFRKHFKKLFRKGLSILECYEKLKEMGIMT